MVCFGRGEHHARHWVQYPPRPHAPASDAGRSGAGRAHDAADHIELRDWPLRPDVETLQRLADTLGVELTELLDEAPSADARRAALRRLCITGAVTLVLTGLWAYLHAVCLRQYQHGDMVPLAAMLITEPLLLCALAWTLLQALCMVTRLRPRRGAPWVHPLVWALFGLCLATLLASVVLPASGVILPRLYGGRAATAALFFLLGALLWLTQPDAGP